MKSPKNTLEAAVRRATAMGREQGRFNYDGAVTGRITVSGPEMQTLPNPLFPARKPAPTEADFRNMDYAEVEGRIAAHAIAEGVDMDMGHFIPDRNRFTLAKRSVHDIGGVHIVANEFAAKAVLAAFEEAATGPISTIHVKPGPHIVATDHAGRTVATFYIAGALAQVLPEIRSVFEAEGYEVIA